MNQGPFMGQGGTQAALGPGSQVAGYLLERQIGKGGMAVVYQARDIRLGRLVALKVMVPALAGDETFRLRFVREAQTAAAVDDPHIIPVYEAGEAGGILFIAMRFVGGGDLRSLLRRQGPLSPDRVASAVSSVASALDSAHAIGLVHRDVKPANMLRDITRPGRPDHVYLSDFGLSKGMLSSHLTASSQFMGTPDYTAPEQIEGEAADGRTDQYALACSAFELLTGRVPFARDESWQTVWAHLNTPPPTLTAFRPQLPPAADMVLACGMAKDPRDRFANCREFADALDTALSTGRLPGGPPPSGFATIPPGFAAAPSGPVTGPAGFATIPPEFGTAPPDSATASFDYATAPAGFAGGGAPTAGAVRGGQTRIGTVVMDGVPGPGTAVGRRGRRSFRRRRMIALTAAGLACAGAAAALTVPRLLSHTVATEIMSNPSLYGLAGVFAPPAAAGRWQEATSVAFSPDGTTLAVGLTSDSANSYNASTFGGESYLYDVTSGKQTVVLPGAGGTDAFSPDGRLLAAAGGAGQHTVYLVHKGDGKGSALPTDQGSGGQQINDLAFSPNGRLLAATDASGGFYLWSMDSRQPIDSGISGPSASNAIAFSPDSDTIAVAGDGGISLFDTNGGNGRGTIQVDGNRRIGPIGFSADGKLLAAALPGGKVGIWDADTQQRLGTLQDAGSQGVASVAFSPDSQTLAAGDDNGKTYLWNLDTGKLITTLANPVGNVPPGLNSQTRYAVDSVAFSPDGKKLATSDTNGSAYLWRVR